MNETLYHKLQRERKKEYAGRFRCSICNKMMPNDKGIYVKWDEKTDVKVCNTHRYNADKLIAKLKR